MKVARSKVVALMEAHDLAVSKKGKPLSNEKLLEALKAGIDSMSDDDGNFEDELASVISVALDEEEDIELTGDDPTVPKKTGAVDKKGKTEAPAKKKKKSKPVEEDSDDDEDEDDEPEKAPVKKKKNKASKDEAPAKKKKTAKPKKESVRDEWNSNPESSAGQINAVFFANKKKPMTIDDLYTALGDETVSRQRVRDHVRRLHTDEILLKDGKNRYSINKNRPSKEEAEEE